MSIINGNFKVDFMIIGAMKSGTTTICNQIAQHPEINFASPKEPHFFTKPDWRLKLSEYEKFFEDDKTKICGEGSTSYTKYPFGNPEIAADLFEYNKNLKFIYIVRDPIERIISQYVHFYLRGMEKDSINSAILKNPIYVNMSRYAFQILPFMELFGPEKCKIVVFERMIENLEETLYKLLKFIGAEADVMLDNDLSHKNKTIGGYRDNVKVDQLLTSRSLQRMKYFVPQKIRTTIAKRLYSITRRQVTVKPKISKAAADYIHRSVAFDVDFLEKHTGMRLSGDYWFKKINL